ncbi:MAG: hypothetical protein PHE17_09030 [Thiothrix sp.]|uniref:hypothetical protein n=1 Tax=Thiothrix sp. TaxID=1032 RepID=UPI00261957C3|nr:hypothetical protein [Thiothrix sp.]MDD5393147.1 hypothetical protein [Thiothrix sp.]
MNGLIIFFAGIITGLWVSAQAKALNLPVFHHIDPLAVVLCAGVVLFALSMRGKRTGGKP